MADVVLDTSTIGEFFTQYFSVNLADRGRGSFKPQGVLSPKLANALNRILYSFQRHKLGVCVDPPFTAGIVVASAFAFVELSRNWSKIVMARYSVSQVHQFVIQPPEWFNIAPVDESLLPFYAMVPAVVWSRGEFKSIEWCDAIHAATVFSRGETALLATTDERLRGLPEFRQRIL